MEPTRILITGANGFVGRHLIAYLLREYAESVSIIAGVHPAEAVGRAPAPQSVGWDGNPASNVSIAAVDLLDASTVEQVVTAARPHRVVHLAARSSGADTDREGVLAVNVEGTRHLLEAASQLSPFPRTLVVSTGYVYGNTQPGQPARESDPVGPLWRYGAYTDSKIEMESVARNYRAFAVIARPFSHSGPGQAPSFVIPAFARQIARIEAGIDPPLLRVGNLSSSRDLLDVRDVVRAYCGLLDGGVPGEAYNVATGTPVVIEALLERLREECRVPTTVEVDTTKLRPADISCSSGDPSRIRAATGWTAEFDLSTTLRDTLDYWRAQTA